MHDPNAAVRESDSVITAEMPALANRLVHQRPHPIHIFWHKEVQELLVGVVDLVRLQAEYVVKFVGPGDLIGA